MVGTSLKYQQEAAVLLSCLGSKSMITIRTLLHSCAPQSEMQEKSPSLVFESLLFTSTCSIRVSTPSRAFQSLAMGLRTQEHREYLTMQVGKTEANATSSSWTNRPDSGSSGFSWQIQHGTALEGDYNDRLRSIGR